MEVFRRPKALTDLYILHFLFHPQKVSVLENYRHFEAKHTLLCLQLYCSRWVPHRVIPYLTPAGLHTCEDRLPALQPPPSWYPPPRPAIPGAQSQPGSHCPSFISMEKAQVRQQFPTENHALSHLESNQWFRFLA